VGLCEPAARVVHSFRYNQCTSYYCFLGPLVRRAPGPAGSSERLKPPSTTFERCVVTFGGLTEASTAGRPQNGSGGTVLAALGQWFDDRAEQRPAFVLYKGAYCLCCALRLTKWDELELDF
jgi:hypothetical protein